MPSIAQLLDCHGLPPREILRDWAWQIYRACQAMPANSASSEMLAASPWSAIEVADDGRLQLARLNHAALDQALSELRSWLAANTTDPLLQANAAIEQPADSGGMLNTDSFIATSPRPESVAPDSELSSLQPSRLQSSSVRRPKSSKARRLQTRTQLTLGAVGILVVAAVMYAALTRGQSGGSDHVATAAATGPDKSAEPATTGASSTPLPGSQAQASSATIDNDELAEVEHLAPLSDSPPAAFDELIAAPRDTQPIAPALSPTLEPSPMPQSESTSDQRTDTIGSLEGTGNTLGDSAVLSSVDPAATDPSADVMQQVTEAIEQAQSQDDAQQPTTDLGSESANVVTLLRDQVRTRYRQPRQLESKARITAWTIQVQRPDGFLCQPSELQTLQPKLPCQWRLVDDSAATPRVCLVVEALPRGKPTESIELCLYGSAEDLPQLKLPLSRTWLDKMLKSLQTSQQQLRWMSTALAQSKPSPETRTQLAQQKRHVAEQAKLCQRLIEIVAQCDRLADLVDGQVTCEITGLTKTTGSP